MRIVIIGAGKTGLTVAKFLSRNENSITIIDHDQKLLSRITEKLDVRTISGSATDPDVLEQAQIQDCDVLIAVTGSDEINILACQIASSCLFSGKKIARIRKECYIKEGRGDLLKKEFNIDFILSPEAEIARSLVRNARVQGALEVIPFVLDLLKVISFKICEDSIFINTPIRFLASQIDFDFRIVCIMRNGNIVFPDKEDVFFKDDIVYVLVHSSNVDSIMENFGFISKNSRRILIMGGGSIGSRVALDLEKSGVNFDITLIESNPELCLKLAAQFEYTKILNGDALDQEIFNSVDINEIECVLALTNEDNVNILSSLLSKQLGCRRSIVLLNRADYIRPITSLGVDSVITPASMVISVLLEFLSQAKLRTAYAIQEGICDLFEIEISDRSMVIGLTINDISIKKKLKIVTIIREDVVHMNVENMILNVGDIIIVLARSEVVPRLEKIFADREQYI
ncbi:MAG: Trk system potassium transporter TrkA [Candidatus Puniceispirillum sp.]|nr:Trk system potassium transporter TrkA [Candidatus Pelagibacter sp.]MBA4283012.1 Trk system potassium transporter TrkA [Candidatus Puniceispirillum sp.]